MYYHAKVGREDWNTSFVCSLRVETAPTSVFPSAAVKLCIIPRKWGCISSKGPFYLFLYHIRTLSALNVERTYSGCVVGGKATGIERNTHLYRVPNELKLREKEKKSLNCAKVKWALGDDRKGTQIDRVMLSLRIGKIAPMVNFQSSRVCHSGPTRERKST